MKKLLKVVKFAQSSKEIGLSEDETETITSLKKNIESI
jgi:uncharacterized protein YnzC (UPF0291/DUF896 family)